ncbi:MAG TPA: AraC family transcriptional regulator [Balneolaceae bacterium]|nr:AraC family transcriptional regulator [Balneolaceae bacterium]
MKKNTLHIKNMVCPRCIAAVRQALEKLGLTVLEVELGKAVVEGNEIISAQKINKELKKQGFELLQGKDRELVEQIKTSLIVYVQGLENREKPRKMSDYLSERLHQNYSLLSSVFSKNETITIERYLIHLKIERVKELLSYEELTLSEIAWKLKYSSVSHLSNQFKQITGMTVTDYKKASDSFRHSLSSL